jgi:hypothetical protein
MKQILMATAIIVLATGCHTSRNAGRPGDETYSETGSDRPATYQQSENDRHSQSRPSNNLRTPLTR